MHANSQDIPTYENKSHTSSSSWFTAETKDPEYDLIVDANEMAGKISVEINHIHGVCCTVSCLLHQSLRDLYRKRFPELEHQVLHPLDYARVVQKLGNSIERAQELEHILPAANIITISMSASSSTGTELTETELDQLYEFCRVSLELDEARQRVRS